MVLVHTWSSPKGQNESIASLWSSRQDQRREVNGGSGRPKNQISESYRFCRVPILLSIASSTSLLCMDMFRSRVGDDGGGNDIIGDGDDGDVSVRSAEGEVVAWSRSAAARSAALANWVTLLGERHGRSPLLCRQLRSAACTLRDGEARVPAHAFGGDRSMRSIALPAGLTSLGEYALMWLLLDDVDRAARRPHESRWVRLLRLLLDDVDRAARQPHEPRYGRLLGLLLVDIDRAARRAPHEPRCVHLRWLLLNDIDRAARRL